MVRVEKLTFGTFFQNAFAVQLAPQIRTLPQIARLLPRIGRFLPKKWKASSKECWVHTHISFQKGAALLQIFWSSVCVFRSCVYNEKAEQQWKGFHKRVSFLKRHTVYGIYSWETQGSNLHVSIPFFLNSF